MSNTLYNIPFKPFGTSSNNRSKIKIRTQKAKGIIQCIDVIMDNHPYMVPFFASVDHYLIQNKKDIDKNYYLPAFARPCPTEPRHGFVDSRVVRTNKQLCKLLSEVLEHDPEGEIILGPYIPRVDFNAIFVSDGIISIGPGNDGATAGKDSIKFNVAPYLFTNGMKKLAGIKKNESVYIETIKPSRWYRWIFTQVRGGPELNVSSSDFIPKNVKVKNIIKPNDNLIEWEKQVKRIKNGTVVYAPGHTLASHAAIHCVLNNIPFVTTFKPSINSIIKSTTNGTPKNKLSRKDFKKGVSAGIKLCSSVKVRDMVKLFYFSISTLHNWPYLRNSEHAGWLLGASSTVFTKLCAALVYGEYRHFGGASGKNRECVYRESLSNSTKYLYKLPELFKDFYAAHWDDGFGGIPWANCAWYSNELWKNIIKVYNSPATFVSNKEVLSLMSLQNRTVNLAHNNGWWFNKFTTIGDLDFIANNPSMAILSISEILIDIYKICKKIRPLPLLQKAERLYAPFGNIDNNLIWVKLEYAEKLEGIARICTYNDFGEVNERHMTLTESEIRGLSKKYQREDKRFGTSLVLRVRGGKYRIPGGKERTLTKKDMGIS